nr:MAG TPA: hypothetical protein [Caudoviricetes sp.]
MWYNGLAGGSPLAMTKNFVPRLRHPPCRLSSGD